MSRACFCLVVVVVVVCCCFPNENQLEDDEDVEWGLVSNQKLIQQTSDDNCTAEQTGQTGVSVRLCASRVVI